MNADLATVSSAKSSLDTYLTTLPPERAYYNDKQQDAGDSILSPTKITLNTSVDGVLGLRYSPTDTDKYDYFTLDIPKTGILKLYQFGDRKVDVSVIAGTTHLMDNSVEQAKYSDAWLGYEGTAQVFAGEHVVIQLTGSGAPSPGSGRRPPTD